MKPDVQSVIEQWPDGVSEEFDGASSEKVPTEILYTDTGYKWGFQIRDEELRHQWFKLDLDPFQTSYGINLANKYPARKALPPAYNRDRGKLVTDYLTALRQHTERYLEYKVSSSVLRMTPIEYIITTPALWTPAAQAKTEVYAEAAGMGVGGNLQIVSEPEAAATYVLKAMDPHDVKVGDTFVICDAGGGTVDLISYSVTSLKPVLEVEEAAAGNGGLCGSTYLNRIFGEHLVGRCRSNTGWDDQVYEEAMTRFEHLKRTFTGAVDQEFSIPVSGLVDDEGQGIRRGKLKLSGTQLSTIFRPVFDEIIALVMGQISATAKPVKAVLLVGGFGQSSYLRQTIKDALGNSAKLMIPAFGWTAVARGALMKGLATARPSSTMVRVGARVARKHYGTRAGHKFEDGIHSEDKKWWDSYHGCYRVSCMTWFIKKGKPVREDTPARFGFVSCSQWVRDGPLSNVEARILCFDDPWDTGAPLYEEEGVTHLVTLKADLSCIPETDLEYRRGKDDHRYYVYDYDISMTHHSASTEYALIYKDKIYDSITAEYA